ncbi:LacI family DNA-binding transcriptional regulator [Pseudonocardia xishanensis]|uniref:HTH lacI-type domain-containing protein n=1 Tax=Pseudonocardia xishanensis TaxID=630995 RepID=A0ABP8RH07_9PSEU
MTSRLATVVDAARRDGVGKSTVSNVLRGTGRVSEPTRERVLTGSRPPRVDGLILSDALPGEPLLATGIPIVTCEDVRGGPTPDGVVRADHGRALHALLDELGAARPALLVPEETGDWAARLGEAYRGWCAAAGTPELLGRIDWAPTVAGLEAPVSPTITSGRSAATCS